MGQRLFTVSDKRFGDVYRQPESVNLLAVDMKSGEVGGEFPSIG